MSFDPSARLLRFRLSPEEAVAIDAQGHRIVAYAEGTGLVRRFGFPPGSQFFADGVLVEADPVRFVRELRVIAESGEVDGEVALGAGTAEEVPTVLVDAFDFSLADERARRALTVQNLAAPYELEGEGFIEHLGPASWEVRLPAGTLGLRLTKRFDRFFANQRARVRVDGVEVGVWLEPGGDRARRKGEGCFGFRFHAAEETTVRLEIDPPAGAPLWSVGKVTVAAFLALG